MDRNSGGRIVTIRWPRSEAREGLSFWVDAQSFPFTQSDILRIARNSFGAWKDVSTADVQFEERGTGDFRASSTDRRNVVLYDATGADLNAPSDAGVIAFTRINWNALGEIQDADIVFNGSGNFRFSAAEQVSQGNVIDLQSVMTHEIGHLLGLDHTPLQGSTAVRPTMYPYYFGGERDLQQDDIAGLSYLYPSVQALNTGSIVGTVSTHKGDGAFGVHVVAYEPGTGDFVVGALSGTAGNQLGPSGNGGYEIPGLPPGDYRVAIEPMAGSVTSRNLGGMFQDYGDNFETDFEREYFDNKALADAATAIRVGAGRSVRGIDFVLGTAIPGHPLIEGVVSPANTPDPVGPYTVEASISDDGGVPSAELVYQVDGGPVRSLPFERKLGSVHAAAIPGQPPGAVLQYRILASDGEGNRTYLPTEDLPKLRFEVLSLSGDPLLYVALRRSRVLSVVDTGPGREVARIPTGETPLSVGITPDGKYVFVANTGSATQADHRVTVVETATHRVAATIRVGLAPLDLAVSPDGTRVYVTNSRSQSISVLDVASLEESRRFSVATAGEGPFGIAVSPDGKRLYVTDIDGREVIFLDALSGLVLERVGVEGTPRSLAVSSDGSTIYVAGFDGGISVVDAAEGVLVETIDTGSANVFRLILSPDERTLYASDRLNARLLVVDLERSRVVSAVSSLSRGRETRDLAVSPDGSLIYVTNQDSNDLVFFDAASLDIVRTLELTDGPRGIAVGQPPMGSEPPGETVAQADFDGSGRVDFGDFVLFAQAFGLGASDSGFEPRIDLNGDGKINFADFVQFAGVFGYAVAA